MGHTHNMRTVMSNRTMVTAAIFSFAFAVVFLSPSEAETETAMATQSDASVSKSEDMTPVLEAYYLNYKTSKERMIKAARELSNALARYKATRAALIAEKVTHWNAMRQVTKSTPDKNEANDNMQNYVGKGDGMHADTALSHVAVSTGGQQAHSDEVNRLKHDYGFEGLEACNAQCDDSDYRSHYNPFSESGCEMITVYSSKFDREAKNMLGTWDLTQDTKTQWTAVSKELTGFRSICSGSMNPPDVNTMRQKKGLLTIEKSAKLADAASGISGVNAFGEDALTLAQWERFNPEAIRRCNQNGDTQIQCERFTDAGLAMYEKELAQAEDETNSSSSDAAGSRGHYTFLARKDLKMRKDINTLMRHS